MSEPRFYVRELTGMVIPVPAARTGGNEATSFYIIDRLYNARVVESFENIGQRNTYSRKHWREKAEARCEQLNEWWRLELKRG